jgi:hypothetical protein
MKRAKTILIGALLLSGSFSHAGFECQHGTGLITVTAEHEDGAFDFHDKVAKVVIATSEADDIEMSAVVRKLPTRIGSLYTYKLPIEGVSFSVREFTNLVANPGCNPKGRVTCDYDWSSSYVGSLTFNGKSYDLVCQVL